MRRENSLSVLTFNLLAPCYFRVGMGRLESNDPSSWKHRHSLILQLLSSFCSPSPSSFTHSLPSSSSSSSLSSTQDSSASLNVVEKIDIFCFQEFWFEESFVSLYEDLFDKMNYRHEYLQRPGGIQDGIAIFYDANQYTKLGSKVLLKDKVGNRVGLLLHLRKGEEKEIVLVATHLTFPHNQYDEEVLRVKQIREILKNAQEYMIENDLKVPLVLCGDMNSPFHKRDPVYQYITEELGFLSSFRIANGREPGCTHFNHQHEEAAVDYIFICNPKGIESALNVQESFVHPKEVSDAVWPSKQEYSLSDHRPLLTRFEYARS